MKNVKVYVLTNTNLKEPAIYAKISIKFNRDLIEKMVRW